MGWVDSPPPAPRVLHHGRPRAGKLGRTRRQLLLCPPPRTLTHPWVMLPGSSLSSDVPAGSARAPPPPTSLPPPPQVKRPGPGQENPRGSCPSCSGARGGGGGGGGGGESIPALGGGSAPASLGKTLTLKALC